MGACGSKQVKKNVDKKYADDTPVISPSLELPEMKSGDKSRPAVKPKEGDNQEAITDVVKDLSSFVPGSICATLSLSNSQVYFGGSSEGAKGSTSIFSMSKECTHAKTAVTHTFKGGRQLTQTWSTSWPAESS